VESCDKDINGTFDMEGLVALISKVTERCRAMQRESEAVVAKQLGFNFNQVLRMRRSFAALTSSGAIGVVEIRMWFQEINPNVEPSTKQIETLIEEFSPLVAKLPSNPTKTIYEGHHEGDKRRRASIDQNQNHEVEAGDCHTSSESESDEEVDVETALEAVANAAGVHSRKTSTSNIVHSEQPSRRTSTVETPELIERPETGGRRRSSLALPDQQGTHAPAADAERRGSPVFSDPSQEDAAMTQELTFDSSDTRMGAAGNVLYFEGYMRLMYKLLKA